MSADSPAPQTPLMRQYAAAKQQYPEALLLFRLGDFYELFYQDAVTAARELQITLTARNKEKGVPIPMCGVPYHAAEGYIAKLIQRGFKVALCEQMEAPSQTKTLVRREVTRVLTPGTAAFQLDAGDNRYLAAVARAPAKAAAARAIGLALLDVSTGEFRAAEFTGAAADARLAEELSRWRPRELLHAADQPVAKSDDGIEAVRTPLEAWLFEPTFAGGVLERHFGLLALDAFGLGGHPWATAAAGAIVHYVKETQRSPLAHVDRLSFFERQQGLVLDAVTARNLELVEPLFADDQTDLRSAATLRAVMDDTVTPMGKRLLRQWMLRPSADLAEIAARHDAVARLVADAALRQALRQSAAHVQDLERLLGRVGLETALPRDLLALQSSLDQAPALARLLERTAGAAAGRLAELAARLDPLDALRQAIRAHLVEAPPASVADGGFIRAGVSAELDELRALCHNAKGAIAQIEDRERARTGIGSLKVRFNNIFGYYIEISKTNLRLAPADYERKQTLVNAERFTTPELKDLEVKILTADEKSLAIEQRLFVALRAQASAQAAAIRGNAAAIAEVDVLANFAHLALERRYVRPQMSADGAVEIRDGRHPVIERLALASQGDNPERFVPNDLYLDAERQRILILTGPNMGGKSTYLRQAALIAILAQMGSFVPAASACLPLFDRIFTRIGASDNLARGRSTFMVEMTEAAVILHQATSASLVILDEIGRGTSTYDGLSLAWAIVEYLHGPSGSRTGPKTLFATHYHELTELARHLEAVKNAHVAVKESPPASPGLAPQIVFLRKVAAGEASRSYGIEVARLAGLPREVIERAREVLRGHEQAETRTSSQLEAGAPAAAPDAGVQLTLFTPLSQQIVDRLDATDLNALTPMDALNLLAELQQQLRRK